ncbi:D-3-phosphoglycerate dehydrogenase [Enterobacter asburiae]|uniref:D-3-phosphoglycerate dehydrogenase n=1 Tax=Enterobacter asburiae TaxID=61645 RepID=A0A376FGK7_ENTAS|nr:D-3-phosphoglycerate dehydrogenase [Enterobacter asburiae]
MGGKDVVLVTGSDLAEQATVMLQGFEVVFAGRQPTEDDLIALCKRHNPVAILVRYGRITAKVMDAARLCRLFPSTEADRCDRPDGSGRAQHRRPGCARRKRGGSG